MAEIPELAAHDTAGKDEAQQKEQDGFVQETLTWLS